MTAADTGEPTAETQERARIQDAIVRLLEGRPLRSTGELTVVQLAVEADVKRWRLTHRHVDLMQEFQAAARQRGTESPLVTPWRERVQKLQAQLDGLQAENADMKATIAIYAQVIDDLSSALEAAQVGAAPTPLRRAH